MWSLENVETRAQKYGESFFIPSRAERSGQEPGRRVRLHFLLAAPELGEPRVERLWVEIVNTKDAGSRYEGSLVVQPAYIKNLNCGDQIEFGAEHIAQTIMIHNDRQGLQYADQLALVSALCLEPGESFCCICRENPECDEDSGWRIFTGREPSGYAEECSNIRLIEIGCLLAKDASLFEVFRVGGIGSAFKRSRPGQSWQKVKD